MVFAQCYFCLIRSWFSILVFCGPRRTHCSGFYMRSVCAAVLCIAGINGIRAARNSLRAGVSHSRAELFRALHPPSRHLPGLLHMLQVVSRQFCFFQILCASMGSRKVVAAHVPHFESMLQGWPFSPRRCAGATTVWPRISACIDIRTGLCV